MHTIRWSLPGAQRTLWLLTLLTAIMSPSRAVAQPVDDDGLEEAEEAVAPNGVPDIGDLSELGKPPPPPPPAPPSTEQASRATPAPVDPQPEQGPSATTEHWSAEADASAPPDADCRASCWRNGRCGQRAGRCVARADSDCGQSEACKRHGQCTADEGKCVAAFQNECLQSWDCLNEGACALDRGAGQCVEDEERYSRPMMGLGITSIVIGGAMGVLAGPMTLLLSDHDAAGVGMMVAGGTLVGIGIPLTAVGARKKKKDDAGADTATQLLLTPTGASLQGTF
ncbi:MAG: hypothetical protein JRI23_05435 [Deltaproteobacteria bacterium]|jgi:hypothetical protein|nr:hypothetical protein [Deltaproteobacteria bacterium]MBW2530995.1 hypothetical protein [Deltaproteobacteria bacterium]